jgi:hypothetical protein
MKAPKRIRVLCALSLCGAFGAGNTFAHHSFAMFDQTRLVKIEGTVRDYQWDNPHVWIDIAVADISGAVVLWNVECASPNILGRSGWSRSTLQVGDKILVTLRPLKDGSRGGALYSLKLPDGRELLQGGSGH